MKLDLQQQPPMIFLVGPPGAGKSTLGESACAVLDLHFLDLSTPAINDQPFASQKKVLVDAINNRSGDIIALPWTLQQDKGIRQLVRQSGMLLLLWAHPLEMQARSGLSGSLFTPSRKMKTREGFGRTGTRCREFRSLERIADRVLILAGSSFDEGLSGLRDQITYMRREDLEPAIVQVGLSGLADEWAGSYHIDRNITTLIVDAMSRYLLHLRSQGKSTRTLSGVHLDLQAAGILVIKYDYPRDKNAAEILDLFSSPPWTIEFKRIFSDSPNAITRYKRNLKGFARFLEESRE